MTKAVHSQCDQNDKAVEVDHDLDHQTYLRVAEQVLRDALSPLKAREIVERGMERGLFGDHSHGRTPEKSMQARLSMDILSRGTGSRFMRVARGRFSLRSRLTDGKSVDTANAKPADHPQEYIAQRRVLRMPAEEVLCIPDASYRDVLTFQGIDTEVDRLLPPLLNRSNTIYVPRSEAEHRDDAKQFVTYVLVQCGQRLLQFQRSYLSRAAEFLRGAKCIGFGGHVTGDDADMLSIDDRGLVACARRELIEELRFPGDELQQSATNTGAATAGINPRTVRLFQSVPLEQLGILNDDSSEVGRRHVAVIYRAWLPDWSIAEHIEKGDSSIKSLTWLDIASDRVDLSEFEYWSQLCLRRFYPSNVETKSVFRAIRAARLSRTGTLVVSGRIGSGKSETASYLGGRLSVPVVKSSEVVQELMAAPPLHEIGRRRFQEMSHQFISAADGPARLATAIARKVEAIRPDRCIVDGIRHPATYEQLRKLLGNETLLVYVHTPPDIAFDFYRTREEKLGLNLTYRDFLALYDAPVESEISSLGRAADLYVYNSFGIEAFRRMLDELAAGLATRTL